MGKVSQQPHSKVNHYLFASQVLDSEALGNPMVMEEAKVAISEEEEEKPKVGICSPKVVTLPFPLRLRGKERFWLKNAHKQVQQWVLEGIKAPWEPETGPQMAISLQEKTAAETQAALDLLTEYVEVGAVSMATCPPDCNFKTFLEKRKVQYLVPWFIISKPEGDSLKHRLIADCKQLNKFFHCPHFKMEHWGKIFTLLRKGMYAAKIDLKHAYFHLPVHQSLKPYLHLKVGNHLFQFLAAPFGLSPLPFIWTQVMKTFSRVWRKKAIFCFIYLDDILVLAFSKQKLQKDLSFVLKTLEESGLTVNTKKSILEPVQTVEHLGFSLDLKKCMLSVPSQKMTKVIVELRKILKLKVSTPRKMASILGSLRSFLMALPQLRCFTDRMLSFVQQVNNTNHWDSLFAIPEALRKETGNLISQLQEWKGRSLGGKVPVRFLHSDSSDYLWAGLDLNTKDVVQEYWRDQAGLHITVKELSAAVQTVMSLAKPKEVVQLGVDNLVAYYYLLKGGGEFFI